MALQEFCNCDFKNLCAIFRSAIAIIYMRLQLQLRFWLAIAIAITIFMLILKLLQCHAIAILMPLICSHLVTLSESVLFLVLSIKTILTKFNLLHLSFTITGTGFVPLTWLIKTILETVTNKKRLLQFLIRSCMYVSIVVSIRPHGRTVQPLGS